MSKPASEAFSRDVPLVVLAAGRATRFGGVKPLASVGINGEAILDVLASDALAAGFRRFVLVIGDETGPALRYHVARTWPADVRVDLALQGNPRGTVDAVLAAAHLLDEDAPFGVVNADDLPGEGGLALLAGCLRGAGQDNAAVCYRLGDSLLGDAPVTRGLCQVDAEGMLVAMDERRHVGRLADGRIVADDGREPKELDPAQLVSMNVWGFRPEVIGLLRSALAAADGGTEVLLPEVVDGLLAQRRAGTVGTAGTGGTAGTTGTMAVRVLPSPDRCIGVTHPVDVALVQAELSRQVGRGDRPAQLWTALTATSP